MKTKSTLLLFLFSMLLCQHIMAQGSLPRLRASLTWADSWEKKSSQQYEYGVYEFLPESPINITTIKKDLSLKMNGGVAYYDGVCHFLSVAGSGTSAKATYYEYDATTWTLLRQVYNYNVGMIATDVAVNPVDGKVYGCVYESLSTGYMLAELNYDSQSLRKICNITGKFVGVAINAEGVCYGINNQGNVYTVNLQTGDVALLGATGCRKIDYDQSATFDTSTGKLYWAAGFDATPSSALYEVDTTTGKATKIVDMPDGEVFVGLYVPVAEAADGAPGRVENLKTVFENGLQQGSISFTMPSETYGGESLTGIIAYHVLVNGEELKTGQAECGSQVNINITLEEGINNIKVYCSNAVGNGANASTVLYVGRDVPKAVSELTVSASGQKVTLSWNAPTSGVNGGYVNPSELTYIITRLPDNVVVANGVSGQQYIDEVPTTSMKSYSYSIVAVNGTQKSTATESELVVVGTAFATPYFEDFLDTSIESLYTTDDVNGDGKTWYQYVYSNVLHAMVISTTTAADDWLITPPVALTSDSLYRFSFRAHGNDASYTEVVEAAYGTGATGSDMRRTLVSQTEINSVKFKTFENTLRVGSDGNYYFGIHALTPDGAMIHVDSIEVVSLANVNAPSAPTNMLVTPNNEGKLQAEISVKLPSTTIAGSVISGSLTQVDVYRDDKLIATLYNQQPDAQITVADESVSQAGYYTYKVYAHNTVGKGLGVESRVYVGLDTPVAPQGLTVIDEGTQLRLKWNPASTTGVNGGIVVPSALKYIVYNATSKYEVVADDITTCEAIIPINTASGEQKLQSYAVAAQNEAGASDISAPLAVVVGAPYELPLHDSFKDSNLSNHLWWAESSDNTNNFGISTQSTFDADGGAVAWQSNADGEAVFNSGKINIGGKTNAKLTFHYLMPKSEPVSLTVIAQKSTGERVTLTAITNNDVVAENAWQQAVVDLSSLKDESYFTLHFEASSSVDNALLVIDNISVRDYKTNDLQVGLIASDDAVKGSALSIQANVRNVGLTFAAQYTLKVWANGENIYDENIAKTLAPETEKAVNIVYNVLANYASEVLNIKVEVSGTTEDGNLANNIQELVLQLKDSQYNAVQNLKTSVSGDGTHSLVWEEPQLTAVKTVDSFEDYEPWTITNFGNWTMRDNDGLSTYGVDGSSWTNAGAPQAYIVFNPTAGNVKGMPSANSGEQYLVCWNGIPKGGVSSNDDWLISPLLTGEKQTITFSAASLDKSYKETFEVYYSLSGTDEADFNLLKTERNIAARWASYSAELPEGTKYFAIRLVSSDCFAFLLDDIEFEYAESPVAYNVYENGKKVDTIEADQLSYNIPVGKENSTWAVSAVYKAGESALVSLLSSGISGVSTGSKDALFDVYTTGGQLVKKRVSSLQGLPSGVYIINKKKVIVQ